MSVSDSSAKERYFRKGRLLIFVEDDIISDGFEWLETGGLVYAEVSGVWQTRLSSTFTVTFHRLTREISKYSPFP